MEYYATLKRKEILTHATIWMNPEDLKLNEVSQPQKANARWLHIYEVQRVVKFSGRESRMVVAGVEGKRNQKLLNG